MISLMISTPTTWFNVRHIDSVMDFSAGEHLSMLVTLIEELKLFKCSQC